MSLTWPNGEFRLNRMNPYKSIAAAISNNNLVDNQRACAGWLAALACAQLAIYGLLTWLSGRFGYESIKTDRPIGFMIGLFAVAFALSLGSLFVALKIKNTKRFMVLLIGAAIAFRVVVLFSHPIQEVDIYRYMWDGAVANQGVSPFKYSPQQVLNAIENPQGHNVDVVRLAYEVKRYPGLADVLKRVHFGQLPTVYPPVSQWVFRVSDWLTPSRSEVFHRLLVMKTVIVAFDLGVMLLLWQLLLRCGLHPAWSIAYGWSPLVLKEFANSGHLDSIAVFLMVASIVCVGLEFDCAKRNNLVKFASALLLGFAFGAKLFPIVLAPLLAVYVWKQQGLRRALIWSVCFVTVAGLSIAPMVSARWHAPAEQMDGLKTFLSRWEINDLIFMFVEENVRPDNSIQGQPPLWFVFVPDSIRQGVTNASAWAFGDRERAPFLLTRVMLLGAFGLIVIWRCRETWRDPLTIYESAFLLLAWFWFLAPTQNPWYWIWALPLVPFARNRIWLLVSGLVLIYYARFWFEYHGPSIGPWGAYTGVGIFDFVIVWIEFAPFLLLLLLSRFTFYKNLPRQDLAESVG